MLTNTKTLGLNAAFLQEIKEDNLHLRELLGVVAEVLTSLGLEVTTGVGGSGVVGVLRKGSSSRSVGFRADMDALPIQSTSSASYRSEIDGRHHGCGHDGHTAMLLGAAQALSESGEFDGTVHFIFQPNEEEGLGAQAMIDDGLFEKWGIDEVYALHCAPGVEIGSFETRAGPMMTFEDNFEIRLSGIGGHASAPHLSDDVMVAGAAVVTALQTIVARSVSPMQSGVVSVTGFETDGSRNLLPSNVVIRGDTRGLDQEIRGAHRRRHRENAGLRSLL